MQSSSRRGPGRPPAAKSAQTRDRILRAAREVFSEWGYDAATFQEIAVRAELTRPAINHYFPSKRHLFIEVLEHANETVIVGIKAAQGEQTFVERMQTFMGATARAQGNDPSVSAFLVVSVLEARRRPDLGIYDHDSLQYTRDFIAVAVRDAIANGELRSETDVDKLSETIVAFLWGLGFYGAFVGDFDQRVAVAEQFLRLVGESPFGTG